jgi:hypothetical protein
MQQLTYGYADVFIVPDYTSSSIMIALGFMDLERRSPMVRPEVRIVRRADIRIQKSINQPTPLQRIVASRTASRLTPGQLDACGVMHASYEVRQAKGGDEVVATVLILSL